MEADKNLIRITHYINPHMFWFVHFRDCPPIGIQKLEMEINEYFQQQAASYLANNYKPKKGETAAAFHSGKNIYIRVKVDDVLNAGSGRNPDSYTYLLWAIDHGIFFHSDVKWLRKLPTEFQTKDFGFIKFGGLHGVAPAELKYDYEEQINKMENSDNWSARAVAVMQRIVDDAVDTHFDIKMTAQNNQLFGYLTVTTHKRKDVDLVESLVRSESAVLAPNFMETLSKIKTRRFKRYEDNEGRVHFHFNGNRFVDRSHTGGIVDEADIPVPEPELTQSIRASYNKCREWVAETDEYHKQLSKLEAPAIIPAIADPAIDARNDAGSDNNSNIKYNWPQMAELRANMPRRPRRPVDGVANKLQEQEKLSDDSSSGFRVKTLSEQMILLRKNRADKPKPSNPPSKSVLNFLPAGADLNVHQRKKQVQPEPVRSAYSFQKEQRSGGDAGANSYKQVLNDERCMPNCLSGQRVLAHGKQLETPAVLAKANFTLDVCQRMEQQQIGLFYRIQTYAWPHLMRRRSFVVINSSQTGKTWCYVPAIVSLIQYAKEDGTITEGSGPTAIIVCPSASRADHLKRLMSRFRMDTVVASGVRDLKNVLGRLLGGCDILVVTPPAFTRLYNMDRNVFVGHRIKHLVFDDMDLSLEHFAADLDSIFTLCRRGNKHDFQLVVTSKMWRPVLAKLIDSCDAVLCIGAYIEAAAYGKCEFRLQLVESHKKTAMIQTNFVANARYEVEKTIVLCNDSGEVEELVAQLKRAGVVCRFAHEDSDDLAQLELWNSDTKDKSMMICSDSVLSELKVSKAKNLIHYSMPSLWSVFCYRFSVFFETIEDYTDAEKREAANKRHQPATFVLLDENNNNSLPRLIDFLTKHYKTNLSEDILKLSKNIKTQRELEKRIGDGLVPLCSNYLEFARCFKETECLDRHVFDASDLINRPNLGRVKLHILEIFSPVHYSARIIAHTVDGGWQSSKVNFAAFMMSLAVYFEKDENHITHYPVCLGDICAIRDDDGFSRCEVLRLKEETTSTKNRIKVKLIDSGQSVDCSASELLFLPSAFQETPAQAVDVRLTGIVPLDHDTEWNRNALVTLKSWLEFDDEKRGLLSLEANVCLSMRNTIWVDSLCIVEKLAAIKCKKKIELKQSLVAKHFCQKDDQAIGILQDAILAVELNEQTKNVRSSPQPEPSDEKTDKMSLSSASTGENDETSEERASSVSIRSDESYAFKGPETKEVEVLMEEVKPTPQAVESWCVIDDIECHNISLSLFETPNSFYVQRADYLQGLISLNDTALEFLSNSTDNLVQNPEIGMHCLVYFDDVISRAKILERLDEASVKLFLVDLGETQIYGNDELLTTNNNIVEMLPFLAIKCNMVGIRPKSGDSWTDDTANAMYDDIIAHCKSLFVRVIRESSHLVPIDGMASYDVLLVDCTNETQDVKINKKLIDAGFAVHDPDSNHFMDLVLPKKKILFPLTPEQEDVTDEDGEDENWDKDIGKKRSKTMLITEPHENYDEYEIDFCFSDDEVEQLTRQSYPGAPENFSLKEARKIQAAAEEQKVEAMIREIKDASELDVVFEKKINDSTLDSDDLTHPQSFEEGNGDTGDMPRLMAKHRYAKTRWQQNESVVRLEISAPDIRDYSLWVCNSRMQYFQTYGDDTKPNEMLNINLFGCIDPQWTSHEQRGLSVVVRLVKTIKGDAWPSLMYPVEEPFWLKFNFDSIIDTEDPYIPKLKMIPDTYLDEDDSDYEVISNENDDPYDKLMVALGD